ncbi:MAG: hypothetical protein AAF840_06005, partial [Bacteroidota bacterium]
AIPLIYFGYLAYSDDQSWAYCGIPLVVLIAGTMALGPQIDWWWWRRYPPAVSDTLQRMLQSKFAFYQNLDSTGKSKFRTRLALYIRGNDFTAQGPKEIPGDIQAMAAAYAIQVGWHQDNFLLSPFEKIVFYVQAFPSPQYPKHWHASEVFAPDGVVIFSSEHLVKSFVDPNSYYPIGLHEYVKVHQHIYSEIPLPLTDEDWPRLQDIAGFSLDTIQQWIGLDDFGPNTVGMVYYHQYPEALERVLPAAFAAYQRYFLQS